MKTVKIAEIIVAERFRKDVGDLTSLVRSIKEVGLLHPIVVSEKGELIAGLRRLRAFQVMGLLDIPVTVVNLSDLRKGEIQENRERKELNVSEMVVVRRFMEPEVKAEHPVGRPGKNSAKLAELKGTESRDVVASFAGVSHGTLEKAEVIVEAAEKDPEKFGELLGKVDEGKVSINAAFKRVKRSKKVAETPSLPEGKFNVILADPPWAYEVNHLDASPESHYATLPTEKICQLEVPSADDAVLFLWATNPCLKDALKVMESWGFQYKTNLVWVKNRIGLGFYFRGQHELLLLGTKGKMGPPTNESSRVSSVLNANLQEHSVKPHLIYEIIEKMYPNAKRIELFAREKRIGWESWGNELPQTV